MNGAGHHIYADRPALFNNIVSRTCDMVDQANAILRPLYPQQPAKTHGRIRLSSNGVVTPPTDTDASVNSDS